MYELAEYARRLQKRAAQFRAVTPEPEQQDQRPPWADLARPEQRLPDGEWLIWTILAGRGWGKTRTGAEAVNTWARQDSAARVALVAATAADVRDVMVEGESGLCSLYPDIDYEPSKRRLTWPNGAQATTYSADKPDRLRGPQHTKAWCDELAAWRYPEAWDMLHMGLRLGAAPQCVVTTTPRPTTIIRGLVDSAAEDARYRVATGSTYDNAANLAPAFLEAIKRQYEGTRLGQQEIYASILDDAAGALWSRAVLEELRVRKLPAMRRVVVAIDPAATSNAASNETGIIICGLGQDGQGYVIDDLSGRFGPDAWARRAVQAYRRHSADRIIAEVNQGGEMVESTLRTVDPIIPYTGVRASKGKRIRAEPIAALYEQRRVHHVGFLPELEDQLCMWDADDGSPSPDRLDAMVWGLTELMKPYAAKGAGMKWTLGATRL